MKKILFSVLAVALVLTGCKEEKNPPLSIADINTYVLISGQVVYESNLTLVQNQTYPTVFDNFQVSDTIPVMAGLRVEARVDYGMYKDGVALNRFLDFYGETDSLGMFHIKIPVPAKSNNFAIASLTMQSFNIDNYPIPNLTTVNIDMGGGYTIPYPSYEILRKTVRFDGQLPTLVAALPVAITASSDPGYIKQYYLGTELIVNPGAPATVPGTPFVVLP